MESQNNVQNQDLPMGSSLVENSDQTITDEDIDKHIPAEIFDKVVPESVVETIKGNTEEQHIRKALLQLGDLKESCKWFLIFLSRSPVGERP